MDIVVIDGQGGGIGKNLIEQLRLSIPTAKIIAIGTNSVAASSMLKAGATIAATGENSVVVACKNADIIAGPIGIILTDSMIGEITEKMTHAITTSTAKRILIPVSKCNTRIAGLSDMPMAKYIENAVTLIKEYIIES
ncbi:MAG: DUF3842 family protein [Oscillospiraceae bacterium]